MSTEKTRILVVDDEPAMRAMAKAMLEALGYETVLANSGEQAVDLYHQSLLSDENTITMAIMDLTLPGGMSGVEALQELQDMEGELPVVATSGYLEENAYEICQQIGFVGVLPKPYTADKLRHLVSWVVSRRGIPGGYSEGMPRPEPEPAKEEKKPERRSAVDQGDGSTATEADGPAVADRNDGKPLGEVTQDVEGIVDRLSDLADFAVSHRGAGAGQGNEEPQSV